MAEVVRPIPQITPELRPFFDASKQGQLVVQKCDNCGTLRFPPRRMCSNCLSREASWTPVSGEGGQRQVPKHDLCLVSGNGGILSTHSTLVLGTAP